MSVRTSPRRTAKQTKTKVIRWTKRTTDPIPEALDVFAELVAQCTGGAR